MTKTALAVFGVILACLSTRPSPDRLLKEAKVTLSEALEAALPNVKDGTPVSAGLREEKNRILYQVNIARGEGAVRMSVDARTKEIISNVPLKKSYATLVGASKISMAKALEVALARVSGRATAVEFELKKGRAVAEVKIFLDGKPYEVKIDAVTGSVLKVELDDDEDNDGDNDAEDDD